MAGWGETSRSPLVRTSDGRCAGTNSSHKRGPSLGGPRAAHLIHSPIGLNVGFSHRKALRNRGRADAGVRTGEVGQQVRGHPSRARREKRRRTDAASGTCSPSPLPSTALSAGPTTSLFPFRFRSIPLGGSLSPLLSRSRAFLCAFITDAYAFLRVNRPGKSDPQSLSLSLSLSFSSLLHLSRV